MGKNVNCGLIHRDHFLTSFTSEGLRMSLNSMLDLAKYLMLDLAKYLLQDLSIDVLYSGKVNQDGLEVSIHLFKKTSTIV